MIVKIKHQNFEDAAKQNCRKFITKIYNLKEEKPQINSIRLYLKQLEGKKGQNKYKVI